MFDINQLRPGWSILNLAKQRAAYIKAKEKWNQKLKIYILLELDSIL